MEKRKVTRKDIASRAGTNVTPLLTTMGLFPEKQGTKCVEVLLDIIEDKKYKHINHTGFNF